MGQQLNGNQKCMDIENVPFQVNCVPDSTRNDIKDLLSRDYHCFGAEDGPAMEVVAPHNDLIESLSYTPVRFDVGSTIDVERSQVRYSNLVVHSSRSRVQKRSKDLEEWLHTATAGRSITILSGFLADTPRADKDVLEKQTCKVRRCPARYFLDRSFSRISFVQVEQLIKSSTVLGLPGESNNGLHELADNIVVNNIQVICTATDFTLFADHVERELDEGEKSRAVLLQYQTDDGSGSNAKGQQRRRLCFLEATPQDKDRFVQAMTGLWLEKRSDGSAWY